MHLLQRLRSLLIITLLLSGSGMAFGQAADPLRQALTDLTTNIDATDDAKFQRATEIMLNALQSIAPERNNYGTDCFVWGQPTTEAPKTYSFLSTAFLAGAARERIYGEPSDALYQAWLNVISYYAHYRKIGSMPEYEPIERLAKLEHEGQLRAFAQSVQANHPSLFDRIDLGPDVARFARDHVWERCGVVSLEVPPTWALTDKVTRDVSYTFTASPKGKAPAAVTVTFVQHRRRTGDKNAEVRTTLERYVKLTAPFANETHPKFEAVKVNGVTGTAVRLSGDAIIHQPPLDSKYRNVEVVGVAIDDYCDMYAVLQSDRAEMPESQVMEAIVQSATLRRAGPPAIIEVKEVLAHFSITSPASKLCLVIPNRDFSDATGISRDLVALLHGNRESWDDTGHALDLCYFTLADKGDGMIVAGWIEPEAQFKGMAKFWEEENREDRLAAKQVQFVQVGDWTAVLYDNAIAIGSRVTKRYKAGSVTHMRAEYAGAGTWIDLHCSLTGPAPSDKSRKALLKFLKQVKVEPVSAQ